jgi:glutathione S-transferase
MLLYYTPGACSLAPHILLREAGIPFELKQVDLRTRELEGGGDFTRVSSKGYVPALRLDSGEILTECAAICLYIADQRPELALAPRPGTMPYYRMQEWLSYVSTEIHKSLSPLFNPAASADWKAAAIAGVGKRFDWLNTALEGGHHLLGQQFSVPDAYLFTTLGWTGEVGIELRRWPALERYTRLVGGRPKVAEALAAEGLSQ